MPLFNPGFQNWICTVPSSTLPPWSTFSQTATATNTVWYQWPTATPATTVVWISSQYQQLANQIQLDQIMRQYENMLNNHGVQLQQHQRLREMEAQQQLRRDYAATEAARVIEPARAIAADRARGLLLQHLSEEQRRTFEAHRWFVVEGGKSKRRFRIRDKGDLVANVEEIDRAGNILQRLCAHGPTHLPLPDNLLTQKIMLEHAEDDFLRVANRH